MNVPLPSVILIQYKSERCAVLCNRALRESNHSSRRKQRSKKYTPKKMDSNCKLLFLIRLVSLDFNKNGYDFF